MATAALGWMFWIGRGTLEPAPRGPELVWQPTAALALTGSSNDTLDQATSGTRRETRAERAQRRKERKAAAAAKREAARERRAEAAEARRAARMAKRETARERHAAARETRRETAEARRAAREGKREAARERRAAAVQAKREAAEAKREAAAARREAAEAPASRHAGILRINSLPWAQVFIDGRMVGYTPQRSISLTPGEHAVRLINPEFAMSKTLQVRIKKGQQITRSEVLEE